MRTAPRQSEIWDAYYEQTDPELREKLLSEGLEIDPADQLNGLRRTLWHLRYTDPRNEKHRVDQLLWQCVNLLCIYKISAPHFLRASGAKEVRSAMQTMGFVQAASCGSAGSTELYREFRNAAQCYLSISSDDKSYRKKYFGMASMNTAECREKLARDLWRLSEGVPERFQLQQELELFSRAMRDQFFAAVPEAQALWDQCAATHSKQAAGIGLRRS